jgi:TRAP-type C4-dicarboxylate transport system substrate-binding protein
MRKPGLAPISVAPVSAAFAQVITLRATATSNEDDEDYDGLVVFKNFVETASNGAIAVELFIGTQLCTRGDECLAGIADGSIDIFVSTSGGAAGLFPYIQVLDLPYLMSDDRVAEHVLSSDFVRELRGLMLEDSDNLIRLMSVGNTGGWRSYANTQRRIETPADIAGLRMRTVPADLPQTLATALGASPTPIAWPELFTSLQTGVVEGTANGITDIMNMRFTDAGLKYLTLDNHSYMGAFWFMNNERFLGMS